MATSQGIKLEPEIRERLKALGAVRDRSPRWLMRDAIIKYLEREEAYEREKAEDAERWEEYLITGEYISHEDMTAWMRDLATGKVRPCPK